MKVFFQVELNEPDDGFDMPDLLRIVDDLKRHLDSGDPVADIPKSVLIASVKCISVRSTPESTDDPQATCVEKFPTIDQFEATCREHYCD